MVHSYKDLPLRLYQIGRKYRDERRPRGGLLRAKEFLMKDLYTFDTSPQAALETYDAVRKAYNDLFNKLKLPYLVADADSGNMGGKLSHEYHFASPKGEDYVFSCTSCDYVANEELVEKKADTTTQTNSGSLIFTGISVDKETAINIHIPKPPSLAVNEISWDGVSAFVNLHAVKKALPKDIDIDTGIEAFTLRSLLSKTTNTVDIYDPTHPKAPPTSTIDITITKPGDPCPRCSTGTLKIQKAIEVGHTFHLGTRYSVPLNAVIALPDQNLSSPIHMGCHGIGVSRIIGAVASLLSDTKGLNWPRVIAPYEVIVVNDAKIKETDTAEVYDAVYGEGRSSDVDIVLDDRAGRSLGWKLKDADLIGYPVIVVLGRGWKEQRKVEVQCRRLGVKKDIELNEVRAEVLALLEQL